MNAPTLQILAFSAPAVNGQNVVVHVAGAKNHLYLAGSIKVMRELARDLLAALPPEEIAPIHGTPRLAAPRRSKLSPERRAAYERVAARVAGGATWRDAGIAENVNWHTAYEFAQRQRTRARVQAQKEARA